MTRLPVSVSILSRSLELWPKSSISIKTLSRRMTPHFGSEMHTSVVINLVLCGKPLYLVRNNLIRCTAFSAVSEPMFFQPSTAIDLSNSSCVV